MYNVLIVEDELLVCQGLNLLVDWEGLGFVVAGFCRDGLSAKRQLEMETFDLVICDMRIPGMSGPELVHWMRQRGMKTLVIAISAYAEFDYAQRMIADGAMAYLLKPVNESLLEEALRRARIRLDETNHAQPTPPAVGKDEGIVSTAVAEIHRDCGIRLTAESLAKRLYVSPQQLTALFRRRFGISTKEYIHQVRMERAKFLLARTEKRIYEIAFEVGFQDIDYFTRVFKQNTGTTPSAYRRAMRL